MKPVRFDKDNRKILRLRIPGKNACLLTYPYDQKYSISMYADMLTVPPNEIVPRRWPPLVDYEESDRKINQRPMP